MGDRVKKETPAKETSAKEVEEKKRAEKQVTIKQKMAQLKVWHLVVLLIVIVGGTLVFVGAAAGWFGREKVVLDTNYECGDKCDSVMIDIGVSEYNKLIDEKKSFIVFVDQNGCHTAERLKGFLDKYTEGTDVKIYRLMFSDLKESSLYNYVKYYPSVALVSKGKPVVWLRADEDEDADKYNDYDSFVRWLKDYL
ncbi:hypothetical protein J5491_02850 [Candidatus Saccharibacteria bacterium]|nr:hypothetical protein [Candidatus Saccharibacteria bacterium]